ncbi:MAG: NADH-quinone oxidoreductase subunit N [Verrucomicrobia bacterium]|jgi:NADH-quinone oxidoreductase subunit N|nr:NADH-quinone oxidoreductase subunit N [Verrucomicrobiota bacterium]
MAFLPELILSAGALVLFILTLGNDGLRNARRVVIATAVAMIVTCVLTLSQQAILFDGAYRVDAFSQWLKLVFAIGYLLIVLLSGDLPDIRSDVKPEYFLFLTLGVTGLTLMVSSIDLITLVISLELSSFPLYVLVAMRREREGQRVQMESAIKYIVFGITATGVMLFGMSYLFGLTGTTSLPTMMTRLQPVIHTPLAIVGLALTFAGLLYKLAVFPFHFWTPDVYQGASNETTSLVASLPKVGAVAVLVRFVSLATPEHQTIALLLTCLAVASMFYGNLIALMQKDLKRLLGFSGIAHAGYALIGFVTLDQAGYTAALFYIVSYLFMVLACFIVVCKVSPDGTNVSLADLAGLHRRSPLLAVTLLAGVFALAGVPPFAGFVGKFALLKAALAKGHLALVVLAVINSAIAIYYYLVIVREACFRDPTGQPSIVLNATTRAVCVLLVVGILALGVAPSWFLNVLSTAVASMNTPLLTTPVVFTGDALH